MTWQAYIDNIKAKMGKTPEDFRELAKAEGLLKRRVKVGAIVDGLKADFGLGRGHAMAIVLTLKPHMENARRGPAWLPSRNGSAHRSLRASSRR